MFIVDKNNVPWEHEGFVRKLTAYELKKGVSNESTSLYSPTKESSYHKSERVKKKKSETHHGMTLVSSYTALSFTHPSFSIVEIIQGNVVNANRIMSVVRMYRMYW